MIDQLLQLWNELHNTVHNTLFSRINSGTSDAMSRHRSESILAKVMAWCLMSASHYLNQCWVIIDVTFTSGKCHRKCWRYLSLLWTSNYIYKIRGSYRRDQSLQWRHNERDVVSNHQPFDCLLNRLFGRKSKETSKVRVTGLCTDISPITGEFPAQRASNTENVSIWWRHHE